MRTMPPDVLDRRIETAQEEIAEHDARVTAAKEALALATRTRDAVTRNHDLPGLLRLKEALSHNPVIVSGDHTDYTVEKLTPKQAVVRDLAPARTWTKVEHTIRAGDVRAPVPLQACRDAWVAAGRPLP